MKQFRMTFVGNIVSFGSLSKKMPFVLEEPEQRKCRISHETFRNINFLGRNFPLIFSMNRLFPNAVERNICDNTSIWVTFGPWFRNTYIIDFFPAKFFSGEMHYLHVSEEIRHVWKKVSIEKVFERKFLSRIFDQHFCLDENLS